MSMRGNSSDQYPAFRACQPSVLVQEKIPWCFILAASQHVPYDGAKQARDSDISTIDASVTRHKGLRRIDDVK